jgi:hypothetical protein
MDNTWTRFWRKVEVIPNGCWLWTAGKFSNGYGCFYLGGKPRRNALAHCFSYEHFVDRVPVDRELDHLCRVRHCVNPQHLEPVTRSENLLRSPLIGIANRKTHCKNGHPLSGENLYLSQGKKHCRECRLARKRAHRARIAKDPERLATIRQADAQLHREIRLRERGGRPAVLNATKTHCPQGHPYEGDNVVTVDGSRKCRTCMREANRRAYLKRSHNVEQE